MQRCTQFSLHTIRKLLAAVDVSVCPDLDQHHQLRRFIALTAVCLFYAAPFEEAFVRRVLSYVCGLALLCWIYIGLLEVLAGWSFGVVTRTLLAAVRRRNRRHVPMLGHVSSLIVAAHLKERGLSFTPQACNIGTATSASMVNSAHIAYG